MKIKKSLREIFRNAVFKRDKYTCVMCGHKPEKIEDLDSHHISDRNLMPFGGYCAANGITLCTDRSKAGKLDCHQKAERLHSTGIAFPGYTPTDLYVKVNSSYKLSYFQSIKLEITDDIFIGIIEEVCKQELKICLDLSNSVNQETWELTCDELNIQEPLIKAYGKGRYVSDERTKRCP